MYCIIHTEHDATEHLVTPLGVAGAVVVNPLIQATINDLQCNFSRKVNAIRSSLTCTTDAIKQSLSELPAGEVKGQVGCLLTQSEHFCTVMNSRNTHQLFVNLSNIHAWDFLHPQLLEYLVNEHGENEAKQQMLEYKAALVKFRNETKMSELSGWFGNIPENPLFKKVVLMLGDGWKDKTYQQFEEVRVSLLRQQILDKSQLGFCGALSGSFFVALFFPYDITEQKQKLQPMLKFFKENDIFALYAEGVCLLRLSDI